VLNRFSIWLEKHIGRKEIVILIILYVLILSVMSLVFIPAIRANTGDMNIFDLQAKGYTLKYAKDFIDAMGDSGKSVYLKAQLPLDFVYPAVYTLLYFGLAQKIFKKQHALVFGVTALLCLSDYMENSLSVVMLMSNELTQALVGTASFFTVLKSALLYTITGILILGALYRLFKSIKIRASERV
jgi:hypothetical protein